MADRRQNCEAHMEKTDDLKRAVFGNGRPGLSYRVVKLEVMIWIVILLVLGNGGLLAYSLNLISTLIQKGVVK